MYKDLLTKDELTDLLSPGAAKASDAALPGKAEVRGIDHKDLAFQFLQETVRETVKEVAQLRSRIEILERRLIAGSAQKQAAAAAEKKAPHAEQPAPEPQPAVAVSRAERHKAQKSKWF